jgi:hypothetical protein
MTEHGEYQDRIELVSSHFNEPLIPVEAIQRWLTLFDDEDKPAALTLMKPTAGLFAP